MKQPPGIKLTINVREKLGLREHMGSKTHKTVHNPDTNIHKCGKILFILPCRWRSSGRGIRSVALKTLIQVDFPWYIIKIWILPNYAIKLDSSAESSDSRTSQNKKNKKKSCSKESSRCCTCALFTSVIELTTVWLLWWFSRSVDWNDCCSGFWWVGRNSGGAFSAGHPVEIEESSIGWWPEWEDCSTPWPHGAGGEEHPACGLQRQGGHHWWKCNIY